MEAPVSFNSSSASENMSKRKFGIKKEEMEYPTLGSLIQSGITYRVSSSPTRSTSSTSKLQLPVKRYPVATSSPALVEEGTPAQSLMADSRNALNNAIAVVKSELNAPKYEYPVKSQHYATSILKGTTWTVQSQQQQQNTTSAGYSVQPPATKMSARTSHIQHDLMSFEGKNTTEYGVTASWERPRTSVASSSRCLSYYDGLVEEQPYDVMNDEETTNGVEGWISKSESAKFFEDLERDIKHVKKNYQSEQKQHSTHQKPGWSYSSLIALALKNSNEGQLTVAEIYAFILENFPYFRTAPAGWKNSVRHNLSLNKCFRKVDVDPVEAQTTRKSCLWMISPDRTEKVEQDIRKWRERNPDPAAHGLARPQDLLAIEEGTKGLPSMDSLHKHTSRSATNSSSNYTSSAYENGNSTGKVNYPVKAQRNVAVVKPVKALDVVKDELDMAVQHILYDSSPSPTDSALSPLHPSIGEEHVENSPLEESFQGPFKRPYSQVLCSPSKNAIDLLTLICPSGNVTPPKERNSREFDFSLSPLRYHGGGFDTAHDALNDNSLMTAALGQSPYKGPVTFPAF